MSREKLIGFNNSTSKEIRWGNGNGEMCVMLGFADSSARKRAAVADLVASLTATTAPQRETKATLADLRLQRRS